MHFAPFKAHRGSLRKTSFTITSYLVEMADEPPAKKARVHFGSGEDKKSDFANAAGGVSGSKGNGGLSEAVLAGIRAGNINIANGAY